MLPPDVRTLHGVLAHWSGVLVHALYSNTPENCNPSTTEESVPIGVLPAKVMMVKGGCDEAAGEGGVGRGRGECDRDGDRGCCWVPAPAGSALNMEQLRRAGAGRAPPERGRTQ